MLLPLLLLLLLLLPLLPQPMLARCRRRSCCRVLMRAVAIEVSPGP